MHVQEELNIISQIMRKQLELVQSYSQFLHDITLDTGARLTHGSIKARQSALVSLGDSALRLANHTQVELNDIEALLSNSTNLVKRAVQLVKLRQEDHGNATLVFTVITIVFLPLNFVCSFFGMNVSDIRDMNSTQTLFWIVAAGVTIGVVGVSILVAFNGTSAVERFILWKERRRNIQQQHVVMDRSKTHDTAFRVLSSDQERAYTW